jgi:hypothetical protein
MEYSLKSGQSGDVQYVNNNLRAHTHAVSEDEGIYELLKKKAWNFNTGLINFTADTGTLIYFSNAEPEEFVVQAIAMATFDGITYSDRPYVELLLDPTGGDLISDASAVAYKQNRRAATTNPLASTTLAYKGKSGGTLTGGNGFGIFQTSKGGRDFFTVNASVPTGGSCGLKITNNLSSGSANIYAAIIGYFKDSASKDPVAG